ncbi:SufB/SufD family protein [Halocynthiibacter sp.]|uniref:SufB/SufD family protein n=1 Tax=Halocynthiibacter sp. TaxID=1979210 RepID=UPI003C5A872D
MAVAEQKNAQLSVTSPVSGGWSAKAREDALARLAAVGLPGRRDEYWKYTRPDALTQAEAPEGQFVAYEETPVFSEVDRLKIVFVDGVFDADQSDDLSLEGVTIERLADVSGADIHWAQGLYGVLETNGQTPVARPLAIANTAAAADGILLNVTGKVSKPVSLIYLYNSDQSDAMLHHVVKLSEGAEITVLENGPAAARFNTVMEIEVADRASFHHVRTQGRQHVRHAVTHMFARLGTESQFRSFTMTVNGALTRNEAVIEVNGDDTLAHIAGVAAGDGATEQGFHHDDTVFITHDAVNCESRQVFKKVLRNGATGVFQGKILVQPDAQKTDGYQISQGLLLDDDSNFLAKPELEIYADDVACSHGSTCGAIDDGALFYLRSRGVPKAEAQDLLVLAFLAEAIDEVADEAIRDLLTERLESWMARRRA